MEQLIHYLIENRYVDNEKSAEKILSVISDEFYVNLLENLNETKNEASGRVSQLRAAAETARKQGDMKKYIELTRQMMTAKKESEDMNANIEPEQKAPRTISGGKGPQTPKYGERGAPDPGEGKKSTDRYVTRLTGIPAERKSLSSTVSPGLQTQGAPGPDPTRRRTTGDKKKMRHLGLTVSGLERTPNRHDNL